MKIVHSIQTKLTLSFVLLIVVVAGGSFLFTFRATKAALKEVMREELSALATTMAAEIDGEKHRLLKPGEEATKEFQAAARQLKVFQSGHPDIKYVYTMRKDGTSVRFMVDPEHGNPKDPGADIGEVYDSVTPELLTGFARTSVAREFVTDKWGTLLSGFAPIRGKNGEIVGLVGVDMLANRVIQKQDFIGSTIYLIMGAGVLLAALIVLLFSKTIIRDVRKLNHAATAISMGEMNATVDVDRKDEIGELAESFSRMLASLKIMMMEAEPPTEEASSSASSTENSAAS